MRTSPTVALVLVLSACGSGGGKPSTTSQPPATPQPHPVDVAVTVDAAREARAVIPAATGGTLSATAADGTVFTLVVPASALASDTEIAMRPIAGVDGLAATGGAWVGVDFQPEGLRLLDVARLTVTLSGGRAPRGPVFGYASGGKSLHLVPIDPSPAVLSVPVLHFSGVVGYVGDMIHIPVRPQDMTPADAEAQFEQAMGDAIQRMRSGEAQNETIASLIQPLLLDYYRGAIQPLLQAIVTDCDIAEKYAPKAIEWSRMADLTGLGEALSTQEAAIQAAIVAAAQNCWDTTAEPCIDWTNGQQIQNLVRYSRMLDLFGVPVSTHDMTDPKRLCDSWHGTATATSTDEHGAVTTMDVSVTWMLDQAETDLGIGLRVYHVDHGSVTWQVSGGSPQTCTYQGGPAVHDLWPDDGRMELRDENAVDTPDSVTAYGFGVHLTQSGFATEPVRYTCWDGRTGQDDWGLGGWLIAVDQPWDPAASSFSGSYTFMSGTYTWSFQRNAPTF